MKLYQPSTIKLIQEKYGFRLTKSLGQNFLTDKNIIDKIIRGADIGINDLVIEIGPGIGVITQEAAEDAASVIAVEIDRNLIPILSDTLADYPNVKIVNQDILKTDVNELIEKELETLRENDREIAEELKEEGGREADIEALLSTEYGVKIIGNLPYYITTPIIMKLLEEHVNADSITIMMQKEVADRIKASPGSKTYGALSVAVQYYCKVSDVASVPKEVFVPRPEVDSTVLRLDLLKSREYDIISEEMFFRTVRAGFGQRRKTLSNSLMGIDGITKEIIIEALSASGIDPRRRAETLSIEDFGRLSDEITKRM